jgi:copper homeostasis protein
MIFLKEACVQNAAEAISAQKLNADRIELCKSLELDGLTPNYVEIEKSLNFLSIPLKVMIRCRPGNFYYDDNDISKMIKQINLVKKLGVKEIVTGMLTRKNNIDITSVKKVADTAYPMKITFHKAIDKTDNIIQEMEKLIDIDPITSILTSGGEKNAIQGSLKIKELIKKYQGRFKIIAAGSINEINFKDVHLKIAAEEYHGRKIVGTL